jgi:hypothetical protein
MAEMIRAARMSALWRDVLDVHGRVVAVIDVSRVIARGMEEMSSNAI